MWEIKQVEAKLNAGLINYQEAQQKVDMINMGEDYKTYIITKYTDGTYKISSK